MRDLFPAEASVERLDHVLVLAIPVGFWKGGKEGKGREGFKGRARKIKGEGPGDSIDSTIAFDRLI